MRISTSIAHADRYGHGAGKLEAMIDNLETHRCARRPNVSQPAVRIIDDINRRKLDVIPLRSA